MAETQGNPLAIVEWPRGLTPDGLAGGFGMPTVASLAGQIEEGFRRRLVELPPAARRFLTVAAADPTGDPALVWRAAGRLGVGGQDASPATEAGLIEVGSAVRFRHPTVRSAVYQAAGFDGRRDAHRALAEVTDPVVDPDRRAWHLALAAPGPDEEVAAELERSASRAQGRGGLAAAAAFLERSAALTLDPERRAHRTIAAAVAHLETGALEAVSRLLATAEAGPLDELHRARVEILRGVAAGGWGHMGDAADLLISGRGGWSRSMFRSLGLPTSGPSSSPIRLATWLEDRPSWTSRMRREQPRPRRDRYAPTTFFLMVSSSPTSMAPRQRHPYCVRPSVHLLARRPHPRRGGGWGTQWLRPICCGTMTPVDPWVRATCKARETWARFSWCPGR